MNSLAFVVVLASLGLSVSDDDLARFPGRVEAEGAYLFAAQFRQYAVLRAMVERHRNEYWAVAADRAEHYGLVWFILFKAHCYSEQRQCHLDELRRQLGEEAYRDGRMPPFAPLEFFEEVP